MRFTVRFTPEAEEDLLRLFDFLLERDFAAAERAQTAIAKAIEFLKFFPFSCRKAQGQHSHMLLRELIIPFGGSGYVALFEIEESRTPTVTILAVRHQREDDYH